MLKLENYITLEQEVITLEFEMLYNIKEYFDIDVFNEKLAELKASSMPEMKNIFGVNSNFCQQLTF